MMTPQINIPSPIKVANMLTVVNPFEVALVMTSVGTSAVWATFSGDTWPESGNSLAMLRMSLRKRRSASLAWPRINQPDKYATTIAVMAIQNKNGCPVPYSMNAARAQIPVLTNLPISYNVLRPKSIFSDRHLALPLVDTVVPPVRDSIV